MEQFGFYTRFANGTPDYRPVDELSSIFESTPLTYELNIEKERFLKRIKIIQNLKQWLLVIT